MLRLIVSFWLSAVAFIAGWDAASIAIRPETFRGPPCADGDVCRRGAYDLVFDNARPGTVVAFLATVSFACIVVLAMRMTDRYHPPWVVPAILVPYAAVCATFGVSIFMLGWTAGTGAWKWIGWGVSCLGALWVHDFDERRSQRITSALNAIEAAGMRIVYDDDAERGAVQFNIAAAGGALSGLVVLAVVESIIIAVFGAIGIVLPAWWVHRFNMRKLEDGKSQIERENEKFRQDIVAQATARASQAEQDRDTTRRRLLRLERKFDILRDGFRSVRSALADVAPDHPAITEADQVLAKIAETE